MSTYIRWFREIGKTEIDLVGGKGANLGELSKLEGINVPEGFCITIEAYKKIIGNNQELDDLLEELTKIKAGERASISEISAKIRKAIEQTPISGDIESQLTSALANFSDKQPFAVRSSATAEDLPTASFAGQQDSYLNIIGKESILKHLGKCWASLFTDRAVTYRIQNGYDHRQVYLAIVIQTMVSPDFSGIMFTADPITSNRKIVTIDATPGLGEALVSGKVSPKTQLLTEQQTQQLTKIGRHIEAHFGHPQDIEWCIADNTVYIVQARPITTLYPVPEVADKENHVYISVGHQQMMTDPIKPLGLSFYKLTTARPMYTAGGRLFVDVAHDLASPTRRHVLIDVLGKSDPIIKDALQTIINRTTTYTPIPESAPGPDYQTLKDLNPSVVEELIRNSQASIEELKQAIQKESGENLIDFILQDIVTLKKHLFDPKSFSVIMTAMNAASWLNEKIGEWLGEKNVADILSQSLPNNPTSEMGLALLDIADLIRPYPEMVEYLEHTKDQNFPEVLPTLHGGQKARDAIRNYLDKYGMRCPGEIDITRTRWSEKPVTLLPMILGNVRNFEPGAAKMKFENGRQQALKKEEDLLNRLQRLPDGNDKAKESKRMIDLVRNLAGYREYPKYAVVCRYYIYKQALLKEAEKLAQTGVISEKEEIYYLDLEELREVIRTKSLDPEMIGKRKADYKVFEKLTPPRVMTSDGEIITGKYDRQDRPIGAIIGLPVSGGSAEGRARVILDLEDANLEEGDILVTTFTDPSWTPLFVSVKALVTEVGGLMTHGAVIAREYGLPAVVGVENATKLIKDGQRIRVNGSDGYVEIL